MKYSTPHQQLASMRRALFVLDYCSLSEAIRLSCAVEDFTYANAVRAVLTASLSLPDSPCIKIEGYKTYLVLDDAALLRELPEPEESLLRAIATLEKAVDN